MHKSAFSAILASTFFLSPAAWADNAVTAQNSRPLLTLEAQAYTEVEQDTVIITLQATKQDADQAVVTQALSDTVSAVLKQLKEQDQVKVSTGNYSVQPRYNKEGEPAGWIGQSQIYLESTDIKAASELAAKYQDRMPVAQISFSVSKQVRSEVEQKLMNEVANAFSARAKAMSVALGYVDFEIKELNLGGSGSVYRPARSFKNNMMASPQMMAEALPIDSGTETVTLSLQGSIYMLDKK